MGLGKRNGGFLIVGLLILTITGCLRAADNMISSTVPLLGTYVFSLGTVYGGVFSALYSGSASLSNWFINPRLSGVLKRPAFVFCVFTLGAMVFALAFTGAETTLLCGVAAGLAIGVIYANIASSATSYAQQYRSEWPISVFSLGLSFGLIFGPLLESSILSAGYETVFLVFGCISIVACVLSFRVRISYAAKQSTRLSPLAKKGLIEGVLTGAIFFVPFGALSVFLPIYAKDTFGISTSLAYSSYIPMYSVSLIARAIMVFRPPMRIVRPIIVSMVITIGGMIAMFVVPNFFDFLIIVALFGIPHGVTFTLSLILLSRTSNGNEIFTANSRLSSVNNLFNVLVPVSVGFAAELIGIRISFLLILIPAVLASLLLLRSFMSRDKPEYHSRHSWSEHRETSQQP